MWAFQDTLGVAARQSSSVAPTAITCSQRRPKEYKITRECKGIKILLAICPFSHRDKDLLNPEVPESGTEPREPSVGFTTQFLACWASGHRPAWISFVFSFNNIIFHCWGFPSSTHCLKSPDHVSGQLNWVTTKLWRMSGSVNTPSACSYWHKHSAHMIATQQPSCSLSSESWEGITPTYWGSSQRDFNHWFCPDMLGPPPSGPPPSENWTSQEGHLFQFLRLLPSPGLSFVPFSCLFEILAWLLFLFSNYLTALYMESRNGTNGSII